VLGAPKRLTIAFPQFTMDSALVFTMSRIQSNLLVALAQYGSSKAILISAPPLLTPE
jgi:hypothetical protein